MTCGTGGTCGTCGTGGTNASPACPASPASPSVPDFSTFLNVANIHFAATENTKEHKDFVNSVPFVAKSNWQLALAIGNIFTLATFFNLVFAPRFARLEAANDTGRDMAKRKIRELATGVVVETDKE